MFYLLKELAVATLYRHVIGNYHLFFAVAMENVATDC